jgi:hypothetical protein
VNGQEDWAMAGKFLKRDAIVDTVKSEHRINAIRKRSGLTKHPISVTSCGCPDPNCGAFHMIRTERTIPGAEESDALLIADNRKRKETGSRRKRKRKGC